MAVFENTCNGSYGGGYRIRLEVTENSTDITNNISNVTIVAKCYAINNSYGNYGYNNPTKIYVDGVEKASASPTTDYRNQRVNTLCSWTGNIEHDSLGNKTISVSTSFSSSSGSLSGGSVSGSVQLSYIPRKSSISATSVDIGSNTSININKADNSFTHTITYSFGSLSGTIATKTSSNNINWEVPTSFYAQIPNSKSGTCTLTCTTYSGNTEIGSTTTTFIATANENLCIPDLNVAVEDINNTTIALTGESSKLVRYSSTARISTSSIAKNSATISKVTINGVEGGIRTIEYVGTNVFEVIATDSRGYSKKVTVTNPMVDYIPLSVASLFRRVSNTSNKVNLTYSGLYWNGDFGLEYNTLSLSYKYREKGSNTWINGTSTLNPTITNNTFSATLELAEDFNYRKNWEFSLFFIDKLINSDTGINNVLKGNGALEIYNDNVLVNGNLIVSDNFFSNANSYSTLECVVGWDKNSDKPIYRKDIYISQLPVPTAHDNYQVNKYSTGIEEKIDRLINLYGGFNDSDDNYHYPINIARIEGTNKSISTFVKYISNQNKISVEAYNINTLTTGWVSIEYTKISN